VRSAAAAGALAVNYAKVVAIVVEGGKAVGLVVVDVSPDGAARQARLSARVIVNAAGPWVDVVRAMEAADAWPRLALSRGVHLVIPRRRAPVERTVIVPAGGGRSIFVVPKGEATYIGTTDTFHPDAEAWPPITAADADYLLAAANARLAGPPIMLSDIAATWSWVRPLVSEAGKGASETSRRDELWTGPAGVLSIAGGKLTAYRRMAERVADKVEAALGRPARACQTARQPLVGGETAPEQVCAHLESQGVTGPAAERLIGLYGAEAVGLVGGPAAEAAHAVLCEGALTLEDYWVRRSGRAWFDPDGGLKALPQAANAMAPLLGWSAGRMQAEIDQCQRRRAADLAFVALRPRLDPRE
jgi:glycerol-3-phosphate dehydrogenase